MLSCRVEGVPSADPAPGTSPSPGARFGPGAREADRPAASAWVRTVDGWERPDLWVATTAWEPGIHPLVVAAGQGLASAMALVALGRGNRSRRC